MRKQRGFKGGDRVRVLCLPKAKLTVGVVLYVYPRPEESHKVRVKRDGIGHRETFYDGYLKHISK